MKHAARCLFPCLAALLLWPAAAQAGRRPFVVASDSPMVAEGDVETEAWLDFLQNKNAPNEWRWWVGPRWAPLEGVEVLALTAFNQKAQSQEADQLWAELLEARWRALDKPFGNLFLQCDLRLPVAFALPYQAQPSIAWVKHLGPLALSAQGGYALGWGGRATAAPVYTPGTGNYQWVTWNAGAAVQVVRGEVAPAIQLAVEGFGEEVIQGDNDLKGGKSTANVGPTLAFAKGRLWFSAGALAGLTPGSPTVFVRGVIGLAL